MTPDEALFEIQQSFPPEMLDLADEFAAMLKGTPEHDIDRECNNIGNILVTAMQKTAPISESLAYGLAFGFSELLKTSLRPTN
jgi:hypothetical protein